MGRVRRAVGIDWGRFAVAILAEFDEADGVSAKLAELGGEPEIHEVTEEALAQAETAAEETASEETASE